MENIFINASRKKYRFNYKGSITTEDLWDLPVTELDKIYKSLRAKAKMAADEESLLTEKSAADTELMEQIEIVKYIVSTKVAETEARKSAQAKAQQKQRILDLIAKKQDEELEGKSVDELLAMLED